MSLDQTIKDVAFGSEAAHITIQRALEAVRSHLGMEVAYLSEFVGDLSVFRHVDAPGLEAMIKPGDSRPIEDVYCKHILAGRLPELIPDTSVEPLARSMPITKEVPIGAHVSVPILLPDGEPYGMFCCLSPRANGSLNERDLKVLRLFADIAAHQIGRDLEANRSAQGRQERIERVIAEQAFEIAYQPIWDFVRAAPVGFEALCRFSGEPRQSPDKWFAEADAVGLGAALETAAIAKALGGLASLPDHIYLSVNASPETVTGGALAAALADRPADRLVIEITEHARVGDYAALAAALAPLREAGTMLAIDDAGAGFASLQHIVQLRPDIIKLDMSLTRAVDVDPARRALASALIFFARETGAMIVAEGIETDSEMETLKALGILKGQGYLLGKPAALKTWTGVIGKARLSA